MNFIKALELYGCDYSYQNNYTNAVSDNEFDAVFNATCTVSEADKTAAAYTDNTVSEQICELKADNEYDLDEIFERVAEEYDLDPDFLRAVAQAESGFDPDAVSSSGAMGIMQLMPQTAKSLEVEDPFNPEQNITGGAKMLAYLLDDHNGNRTLALAGYNAGPNAVLKYGGVPPYSQTINYINKINNILGGALDGESWTIDGSEWSADANEIKPYTSSYTHDKTEGVISAGDGTLGMSYGIAGVGYSNNSIYDNAKFNNKAVNNEVKYQGNSIGDINNVNNINNINDTNNINNFVSDIINSMTGSFYENIAVNNIFSDDNDDTDSQVKGNNQHGSSISAGTSPQSMYEAAVAAVSPLIAKLRS